MADFRVVYLQWVGELDRAALRVKNRTQNLADMKTSWSAERIADSDAINKIIRAYKPFLILIFEIFG